MNQKLTPEQREQLKQHAAACIAATEGKPWEWLNTHTGEWYAPHPEAMPSQYYPTRPKPEPVVNPWTLDTAPLPKIRRKSDGAVFSICSFMEHVVSLYNGVNFLITHIVTLARDFEQLDGTPCGIIEQ